jgi:AbrB family looped-hinge helix DNA binding protein
MNIVTISKKFHVVIPRDIRERFALEPGQRMQVLIFDHRIEFVPLRPAREMRGFLRGLDTTLGREHDREDSGR